MCVCGIRSLFVRGGGKVGGHSWDPSNTAAAPPAPTQPMGQTQPPASEPPHQHSPIVAMVTHLQRHPQGGVHSSCRPLLSLLHSPSIHHPALLHPSIPHSCSPPPVHVFLLLSFTAFRRQKDQTHLLLFSFLRDREGC